ncbi:MAG: hypothetical protein M3Q34_02425 [bacterium]|nr:hypothetical protein [bacterium]
MNTKKKFILFFSIIVYLIFGFNTVLANISEITYDNKSISVGSQDGTAFEAQFKSNGTKMYMLGYINKRVYQYTLSTPWDVSTATYDSVNFSVLNSPLN